MKKEQALHLRMDFSEAINSKKAILQTEMCLLEIIKNLGRYNGIRKEEVEKKQKMEEGLKRITSKMNSVLKELPKIKTNESLQLEKEEIERKRDESKEAKNKKQIESELMEIRNQIAKLEGRH